MKPHGFASDRGVIDPGCAIRYRGHMLQARWRGSVLEHVLVGVLIGVFVAGDALILAPDIGQFGYPRGVKPRAGTWAWGSARGGYQNASRQPARRRRNSCVHFRKYELAGDSGIWSLRRSSRNPGLALAGHSVEGRAASRDDYCGKAA